MISFLRTIIMYILVILVMRMMGKRQIGQLQPYEVVIALMISDLASMPMQDTSVPLMSGIIPILSLLFSQLIISYMVLKNKKARQVICGKPCVLLLNGKIIEENLRNEMYNLDDLTEALRVGGYPNPAELSLVVLETGGSVSIVPKGAASTLTPADMKMGKEDTYYWDLIKDGDLNAKNLIYAGIEEKQLCKKISEAGAGGIQDVLYCNTDNHGNFFIQLKDCAVKKGGRKK